MEHGHTKFDENRTKGSKACLGIFPFKSISGFEYEDGYGKNPCHGSKEPLLVPIHQSVSCREATWQRLTYSMRLFPGSEALFKRQVPREFKTTTHKGLPRNGPLFAQLSDGQSWGVQNSGIDGNRTFWIGAKAELSNIGGCSIS